MYIPKQNRNTVAQIFEKHKKLISQKWSLIILYLLQSVS